MEAAEISNHPTKRLQKPLEQNVSFETIEKYNILCDFMHIYLVYV